MRFKFLSHHFRLLLASAALLQADGLRAQIQTGPLPAGAPQVPFPEIKDIAPPVTVFPWPMWMVISAIALCLLLAILLGRYFLRQWRNRPQPPPPTPFEIAMKRLSEAREMIANMDAHNFSILVSDILRTYVSGQYSLPATKQTSPEFLASLAGFTRFSESEKTLLGAFLDKCDLIKFARIEAGRADSEMLLDEAIRFVKGGAA